MASEFKIKIEGFEGPLDLLLSLVEKRKLTINDVSLSKVTDEYISHIEKKDEFPLLQTANFILIASTLLLIKSKSLLPSLELTEEEEESIGDLERRLKLYKQIKELVPHISERFGKYILFGSEQQQSSEPVFSPSKDVSIQTISTAIKQVLNNLPKIELVPKVVVKKIISLEEMIEHLTERINKSIKMSFSEFSQMEKGEKIEVIIGFLAMLELVKQGIISVSQENAFSDITMETDTVSVPIYE